MKPFATISVALVSITLATLFAGCSDDDPAPGGGGSSTSGPRTVRVEEIRAALRPLADADCQWLFRCCNGDERAARVGVTGNAGECTDRLLDAAVRSSVPYGIVTSGESPAYSVLYELNRLSYGFDRGRVTVDKAALDACVQRLASSACTTVPTADHCVAPTPPPRDNPCTVRKILVGKQKLGEDCSPGSTDCAEGFHCAQLRGDDGVCVKSAVVGDTCFSDNDCGDKLVCDYRSGKCVEGGDVGAACSYADPDHPEERTEAERCRRDLHCDTITSKCGSSVCTGGSYCNNDSMCPAGVTCVNGRCGKLLKAGEPCGNDDDCESSTCRYRNGRSSCTGLGPVGAACNDPAECASGYCKFGDSAGVCAATIADGQVCTSDGECTSGRCRPGTANLVCSPAVAPGTTCDGDEDCSPLRKLFCFQTKCTLTPLPNGANCTAPKDCQSEVCFAGKCAAKSVAGSDCNKADVPPCDTAFYCDSTTNAPGKCVARKRFGARCVRDDECAGGCTGAFGALRCNTPPEGTAICTGSGS